MNGNGFRKHKFKCTIWCQAYCILTCLLPPPRGPNLEPRGEDGAPRHPPPPPPSGGDEGGGGKDISSGGYKTAQQVAGEAVLQRVMEDVEGVSFSFQ